MILNTYKKKTRLLEQKFNNGKQKTDEEKMKLVKVLLG